MPAAFEKPIMPLQQQLADQIRAKQDHPYPSTHHNMAPAGVAAYPSHEESKRTFEGFPLQGSGKPTPIRGMPDHAWEVHNHITRLRLNRSIDVRLSLLLLRQVASQPTSHLTVDRQYIVAGRGFGRTELSR